jgi:hypothetical protein
MRKILTMAMLLGAYLPVAHADSDGDYDDYAIEPADVAALPRVPSPATVADFYQPLGSYGYWVDDATYGRLFVPYDTSFQPYTNGYWAQDAYGSYEWVSSSPMGMYVEHYGRWVWQNQWMWMPDTTYSPGWVDWQYADDGCVGWAPLGPSGYTIHPEHYHYVEQGYMTSPEAPQHYHTYNTYGSAYRSNGSNNVVVVPSHVSPTVRAPSPSWNYPAKPAPRVVPSTPAPRYTTPAPRYSPPAPRYTPPARVVSVPSVTRPAPVPVRSFTPRFDQGAPRAHGRRGR